MRRLTVRATVKVPRVPNFLLYDGGKIPVGDASDDELRRIGEAWTEELLANAARQRAQAREDDQG